MGRPCVLLDTRSHRRGCRIAVLCCTRAVATHRRRPQVRKHNRYATITATRAVTGVRFVEVMVGYTGRNAGRDRCVEIGIGHIGGII